MPTRSGAPDPQNPQIVAVKTSSSSALVRAIKRGTVLSFTTEDRSGEMMLMFVTLRGSSKALSRISCMPYVSRQQKSDTSGD